MDLSRLHSIFFLGIGGIGMSAIARHFHAQGVQVCGYDKTPSANTDALQAEGINVSFIDDASIIPAKVDLLVFTPAVPKETALYQAFLKKNIQILKRAELLGLITAGKPTIAVAGTHGKTTICTMVTHIMKTAGMKVSAFLGGISANYYTNYVSEKHPEWMVVEADEFDRSFLHLSPDIALISAIDADHLEIYGSFEALNESFKAFAARIKPEGALVIKKGLESKTGFEGPIITYHTDQPAALFAKEIDVKGGKYFAAIDGLVKTKQFALGLPGKHNLENALGAAAIANCLGIEGHVIVDALSSFKGVKRRFEILHQGPKTVFVDDYAHHPEEIRACIGAARELFPAREITVIFQPHLYSRTRDLAEGFAKSLGLADRLILLDIYPARELPVTGVNSAILLGKIKLQNKQLVQNESITSLLEKEPPQVLITMGAGDIDRLTVEIANFLRSKGL